MPHQSVIPFTYLTEGLGRTLNIKPMDNTLHNTNTTVPIQADTLAQRSGKGQAPRIPMALPGGKTRTKSSAMSRQQDILCRLLKLLDTGPGRENERLERNVLMCYKCPSLISPRSDPGSCQNTPGKAATAASRCRFLSERGGASNCSTSRSSRMKIWRGVKGSGRQTVVTIERVSMR